MFKNKFIAIILTGIMALSFTGCNKEEKKYIERPDQRPDVHDKVENNQNKTEIPNKVETQDKNEETIKSEQPKPQNKPDSSPTKPSTETYSQNDLMVINTFKTLKSNVDTELKNNKSETVKDKVKGTFITIVDFIFYDGEINGIKFDDLSEEAKQNILDTASQIDSLIMKKFPNYKDDISSTTSNAFKKASELIKKGATNIKNFSKDLLGEENYNAIIDAKDDLVKYTKNAFNIVGSFASNLYESSKDKLKDWYEKFKKENED